jgi:Cu(I)/Ag(I) efflux system membrane fusion protein
MSNKWIVLVVIALVPISYYLGTMNLSNEASSVESVVAKKEKMPLFYRNPMNPEVTSPVPAKDNMGMDYIPVYADDDNEKAPAGTVKIDSTVVQNIGVRTATAEKKDFGRAIRTVGRIDFDEERVVRMHPKVEGWIDEIFIDKTGEKVKEDTMLLSIYSPMLVTAQQEYLLALNNLKNLKHSTFSDVSRGADELLESSKERLELLDVPAHQLDELEKTRKIKKNLHIHSPAAGTIVQIGAREGQYVTPKTELYMIVDLSKVWVYADIYEYEIPWVRAGDKVDMTLASAPGNTFNGEVVYIYPYSEAKTRTTKVRIVFDNKDNRLRPNMFSDIVIHSQQIKDSLVIPSEAVVRSGKAEQVFIVKGEGKYEPRLVKLGIESNGEVAVLSGLKAGEEVVTSAQFLVDSESKLREAAAKMVDAEKNKETQIDEGGHDAHDHSNMQKNDSDNEVDHSKMNHDMTDDSMLHKNMKHPTQMDHGDMDHEKMDHSQYKSMSGEHAND